MESIGKVLLLLVGLVFTMLGKVHGLARLPGDIVIHRGNFTLYIPLVTMLLVSVALTIVLNLVSRLFRG